MKILFIGDIVAEKGREAVEQYLPEIKQTHRPQLTIANGENISSTYGRGMTEKDYKWMLSQGIDVITMGNHTWDQKEIYQFIDQANCLVRPVNLPASTPGKGVHYVKVNQTEVAIINVLGSVFMGPCIDSFQVLPDIIAEVKKRTNHIIIDFHAEATSEKQATAWLFDGQVTAVLGTHTHVQTNDARVLPQGTALMSDVGMTGALNSIIGFRPSEALIRFETQMPQRLTPETEGPTVMSAVVIETDNETGQTKKITPIYKTQHDVTKFRKRPLY